MTNALETERLLQLVRAALAEADQQENTLVAALLAECVDALQRPVGSS